MINWRALSSWGEFEVQSGCLWTEVLFFCVFVCEDMNILRMGIISDFRVFFPLSAVGWWINITLRKQQDLISLFVVKDDRRQRWVKRRFSQEILLLTWFLFVRSITFCFLCIILRFAPLRDASRFFTGRVTVRLQGVDSCHPLVLASHPRASFISASFSAFLRNGFWWFASFVSLFQSEGSRACIGLGITFWPFTFGISARCRAAGTALSIGSATYSNKNFLIVFFPQVCGCCGDHYRQNESY